MDKTETTSGPDDCFAVLMRSAEDGSLSDDVGRMLRDTIVELGAQAERTNLRKKGVFNLKITITRDPGVVMETTAEITTKLPKMSRATSIHFVSDDGDISNRRPERQISLDAVQGGKTDPEKAKPTHIKPTAAKAV